jgi:hypothetical protein
MANLSITANQVKLVSGPTVHGTLGGTVTKGMHVYKDSADGKVKAGSNTTLAASQHLGLVLNDGDADDPVEIATYGAVVDLGAGAAAAAGKVYYPDAAGALSPHTDATTPNTGEFGGPVCLGIGNNYVLVLKAHSPVAAA